MPPPDRWGDYSPLGSIIEGTRILCCKVPLKYGLVRQLPEEERFTPEGLINKVSELGHSLGLVVDLTFTKKYYNNNEFTNKAVRYEKIFTKGHEVPSDRVYGRFANILNRFIEDNKENSSAIAVHCTHGVNRTGYLICRYLIENHSMSPEDAIKAFNIARGHDLERVNYLEDLKTRKPGEVTEYDSTEPMSDDDESSPAGPSRFPRPGQAVENSYSKLREQHSGFSVNRQQQERDYEMRNKRGQSPRRNRERNSSNWRQSYEEEDGYWCQPAEEEFNGYQGGYRDFRNVRDPYRGDHSDNYSRGRPFRGHYWDSYDGGRNHRQGSQYGQRDYYVNDRNGQGYGWQGGRSGRGRRYNGYGHENGWNESSHGGYNSPMRYNDWSANGNQYANSGWTQDYRGPRRGGRR